MIIIYALYLIILLMSFGFYAYYFKKLSNKEILILLYISTVIITEIPALYLVLHKRHNLIIYNIFLPIQYMEVVLYTCIDFERKIRLSLISFCILLLLIFLGVMSYINLNEEIFNTIFLLFEGFIITLLAIYALYNFLINDLLINKILLSADFWTIILIFSFWCITYFYWGFQNILARNYKSTFSWVYPLFAIIDCLFYFCLGLILLLKKKNVLTD